jgi:hypothetical protein
VKYRLSNRAVSRFYNHAIVLEASEGNFGASTVLRTEDDGYRGTAHLVVGQKRWWFSEDTPRTAVKPGKYRVSMWWRDDYFVEFKQSAKSTITFTK